MPKRKVLPKPERPISSPLPQITEFKLELKLVVVRRLPPTVADLRDDVRLGELLAGDALAGATIKVTGSRQLSRAQLRAISHKQKEFRALYELYLVEASSGRERQYPEVVHGPEDLSLGDLRTRELRETPKRKRQVRRAVRKPV